MRESKNLNEINYFLNLMGEKETTEEQLNSSNTTYTILDDIGFIAYSIYYERAEIDYIYVKEEYRKKGYGTDLLKYVINKSKDLDNITLEVNVNNKSAINLYKNNNFEIAAKREKYYQNEDAYLMIRKMI
ncbi:MAG: GNAT family N-acetyltransferase [Bacilli bacterium]|nr:GNAT family N-acetyltransferase [Bacilli bacterium]